MDEEARVKQLNVWLSYLKGDVLIGADVNIIFVKVGILMTILTMTI